MTDYSDFYPDMTPEEEEAAMIEDELERTLYAAEFYDWGYELSVDEQAQRAVPRSG